MNEENMKKYFQKMENYMGVLSEQHAHDLQAIGELVQSQNEKLDRMNGDMNMMDQRLSSRIDEMDQRLSSRIDEMDQRFTGRMDSMENKLDATFEETGKIRVDVNEALRIIMERTDVVTDIQKRLTKVEQAIQ